MTDGIVPISDVEGGLPGRLRATALIAVMVGAVGSVGLMLRAGHPPLFLRVLFAIWVLSPFMVILVADRVSKRWSAITRTALHGLTLVVTLCSLAIYGYAVWRPPKSTPAFVFVVVAPASWLLIATVLSIAALVSSRRS